MVDCVLIQHGVAWEIWRNTRRNDLPPMAPELFGMVAEVPAGLVNVNDIWDGQNFNSPPVPPAEPRLVRKALIVDRLHAAGKLEAALSVLNSADAYTQQRWLTRDSVYFNDPTLVAALTAIGADVAAIMAVE